jgi:hypothetical protein
MLSNRLFKMLLCSREQENVQFEARMELRRICAVLL